MTTMTPELDYHGPEGCNVHPGTVAKYRIDTLDGFAIMDAWACCYLAAEHRAQAWLDENRSRP